MNVQRILIRTILAAAVLVMTFLAMPFEPAFAESDRDTLVKKAMVERTNMFCKEVLPAWFAANAGVRDPEVRTLIADCYLGHARLALLGVKTKLSPAETTLREVPATLLQQETEMDLDIYRPLAGRVLRFKPTKSAEK